MRRATSEFEFIFKDDKFIGISLGYDFCAEHEMGIGELSDICNMKKLDRSTMGIDNRIINNIPKDSICLKTNVSKDEAALIIAYDYIVKRHANNCFGYTKQRIKPYSHKPLQTAWSYGDLGIYVSGVDKVKLLQTLTDAILNNNAALTYITTSSKRLKSENLCLVIVSELDDNLKQDMYIVDKVVCDLNDYVADFGNLKKELNNSDYFKNSGFGSAYLHCCSPSWIDYFDDIKREEKKKKLGTNYDVQFWINSSLVIGNFAYEDIQEFLKTGKGKILESIIERDRKRKEIK